MHNSGFIAIHRKLLDWKYYMFPSAVSIWIYILLKANWKDGYFLGTEIPRGSFATSISKMASDTGISEPTIRRWLKRFEDDGQIERKTSNRFTLIKVSNYAAFQDIEEEHVIKPMNEPVTDQMINQMTKQMTGQMTPNRTKKQNNNKNKEINRQTMSVSDDEKKDQEENFFESIASWKYIPSLDMIAETVSEEKLGINPEKFYDYYTIRGWETESGPIRDWKKLLRSWAKNEKRDPAAGIKIPLPEYFNKPEPTETDEDDDEIIRQIKEMQTKML